ncbi:uncharacterized protein LOC141632241 [Silene latifolia]|uniref:uncharacterized protein LOC141632241 n=1 Tax=Silene latifolia TaxID=37657 RepID=UPI003D77B1CF
MGSPLLALASSGGVARAATLPVNLWISLTDLGDSNSRMAFISTPARAVIRLSRQELIDQGSTVSKFGQFTFMEALNNATPKVGLFGLLETKVKPSSLKGVRDNICNGWCVSTNTQYHKGGRVWIIWKPNLFNVQFIEYNAQFIHTIVQDLANGSMFYFTIVYAFNGIQERKSLWSRLVAFNLNIQGPWFLGGDFNAVLKPSERLGGVTSEEEMEDFQICLEQCSMRPEYYAHFHTEGYFDHTPCLVQKTSDIGLRKGSFKYFNMWSDSELFIPCVTQIWGTCIQGTPMFQFVKKLKLLKNPLKKLNRDLYADVENNTMRAWKHLEHIQIQLRSDPANVNLIGMEIHASKEYLELQKACDSFLMQKSKATWICGGDSNSKLFHSYMKQRQAKNKVLRIADENGTWLNDPDSIQEAFLSFYQNLLGESKVVQAVNTQEIREAVFHIPGHKAPGPDGFTSAFYKDAWQVIGEEVCTVVKDFFLHGRLLKQVNHTLVSLVPKVDLPQTVGQFRPISCCNVIYKVISKLLCTRLARVLPHIISPTQGGFVKGRNIIENILVCQDIIRLYKRTAVSPRCLIKVDLKKAYDSVNWQFLSQMLDALLFPAHFKKLLMECVTSASYSLVLNGNSFGFFHGKKGLRQGDPLSPLLFTIAMEYLTRILNFTTEALPFNHHSLCRKLKLSHLMFADDLLLFSRGDSASVMLLLRSFATFSRASGLEMNNAKSNIYFNGVHNSIKQQLIHCSGCVEGQIPFRYLGVPIAAGKLGKKECKILVEKIVDRIRILGARKISYAGRLILVKSVLTSLFSYWANIFLIPKGVLKQIDNICRNYLWDGTSNYMRVPLVGWDHICTPKSEGGLGIRNSYHWNVATIGKLVWWIYSKPDSLWVKWVHQVYIKSSSWSEHIPKCHMSGNWKAICKTRDLLLNGYSQGVWLADLRGYSVQSGYDWLRLKETKVGWAKLIWNPVALPKHSFVNWLVMRNALNTKEKLHRLGIIPDDMCCICQAGSETVMHLFQQCHYFREVLHLVCSWLQITEPQGNCIIWLGRRKWTLVQREVCLSVFMAVTYSIWQQRNSARLEGVILRPTVLFVHCKNLMKIRLLNYLSRVKMSKDRDWIMSLCFPGQMGAS